MRAMISGLTGLIVTSTLLLPLGARAQEQTPQQPQQSQVQAPPVPSQPPPDTQTLPEQQPVPDEQLAPPPSSQVIAPDAATAGQWVYTDTYGWLWVPATATTYEVGANPYVYLYTPSFGWTWYISPWGRGPFFVGPWVHGGFGAHVWFGNRWVAPRYGYGYGGYRGGYYNGGRYYGPPVAMPRQVATVAPPARYSAPRRALCRAGSA